MNKVNSVATAKAAHPGLIWRGDNPKFSYVVITGDKKTGEIGILLAMEGHCLAPKHRHHKGGETITCYLGEMHGTNPNDLDFILTAGQSIHLEGGSVHQPYVHEGGFALVYYHQPTGATNLDE